MERDASHRKSKVLIAEDDEAVREAIRLILEPQYVVVEVTDGLQAFAVLRTEAVDAALVDVRMPGMDGIELLRAIRQQGPSVPVIMVTVLDDVETAVKAMKLGALDYLVKPFDPDRLRDALRTVLRHGGARLAPPARTEERQAEILLVTPEPGRLIPLKLALEERSHCHLYMTAPAALHAIRTSRPDIVVFEDAFGADAARAFFWAFEKRRPPDSTIVIVTPEQGQMPASLGAAPRAAYKMICRPCPFDILLAYLHHMLAFRFGREEAAPRMNYHVTKAIDYMATHYKEYDVIVRARSAVALSAGHFRRIFLSQMGASPTQYVIRLRLEVLKCLLLESQDKLEALAERVGFCDAGHLSRVFKQYTGERPGDFRRRRVSLPAALAALS